MARGFRIDHSGVGTW